MNGAFETLPPSLEYSGEFGPELLLFLPYCHWLSRHGYLRRRRIVTYSGMRCFYEGLRCREIVEKTQQRLYVPPQQRPAWLPVKNEHDFDGIGRPERHVYPDLRARFRALRLDPDPTTAGRPILVIHNKHCDEWGIGPVNFISLETLDALFGALKRHFSVVYIRHGIEADDPGYSADHNVPLPFDDKAVLAAHPEVLLLDRLHARHRAMGGRQDINTFKNVLYSRCHRFISSQGGGSHQMAFYPGSLLAILHRRGEEERWAYRDGYYRFVADIPPALLICRDESALLETVGLFGRSVVQRDRIAVAEEDRDLLALRSPEGAGVAC